MWPKRKLRQKDLALSFAYRICQSCLPTARTMLLFACLIQLVTCAQMKTLERGSQESRNDSRPVDSLFSNFGMPPRCYVITIQLEYVAGRLRRANFYEFRKLLSIAQNN